MKKPDDSPNRLSRREFLKLSVVGAGTLVTAGAFGPLLAGCAPATAKQTTLNLLIVGSIANIIVVDQAAALGVRIGWREHARVGVPVTVATLLVAAAWLAVR